jgi:hypothetical protein
MKSVEEGVSDVLREIANLETMLVAVQRALEETGCESVAIPRQAFELADQPLTFRCRPRGGIRV